MSSSSYRCLDYTNPAALPTVAILAPGVVQTQAIKAIDFETFSFQAEWTGTIVGTLAILGSIDGVNFRSFGAQLAVQPGDGSGFFGTIAPLYGHGMKYLMMTYTNASGTGTMTITALGKTR